MSAKRHLLLICFFVGCLSSQGRLYGQAKGPDRQVTSVTFDPPTIQPGIQFSVKATIKNAGNVAAGYSYTTVVSSFTGVTSLNQFFERLDVGEERQLEPVVLQVPSDYTAGNYSVRVCFWPMFGGELPDLNPSNDCLEKSLKLESPDFIDFKVVRVTPGVTQILPRSTFSTTVTLTNTGNVESKNLPDTAILLSKDATISRDDSRIGFSFSTAGPLKPGEVRTVGASATLEDYAAFPAGRYYIGACVDYNQVQVESDEGNNCSAAQPIDVLSNNIATDLSPGGFRFKNTKVYPGDLVDAEVDIFNVGPLQPNSVEVAVYLSSDDVIRNLIPIGTFRLDGTLPLGAGRRLRFSFSFQPIFSRGRTVRRHVSIPTKRFWRWTTTTTASWLIAT